jgi:hypothetical protein
MVIELVYVQGFEPSATAINNFISFLNARSNKPGITVVKVDCLTRKATLQIRKLAIEDANRTKYNTANQIAVWALLLTEHPLRLREQLCFRDSL